MSKQPILSCKGPTSDIQVFLVWNKTDGIKEGQEVYLQGKGNIGSQKVDFGGNRNDELNLTVFQQSGTTRIYPVWGWDTENINCNKNVFKVNKSTYGNHDRSHDSWEKSIKGVKLALSSCNKVDKVTKCDIKIKDGNGLEWHPAFQPKAFFK